MQKVYAQKFVKPEKDGWVGGKLQILVAVKQVHVRAKNNIEIVECTIENS